MTLSSLEQDLECLHLQTDTVACGDSRLSSWLPFTPQLSSGLSRREIFWHWHCYFETWGKELCQGLSPVTWGAACIGVGVFVHHINAFWNFSSFCSAGQYGVRRAPFSGLPYSTAWLALQDHSWAARHLLCLGGLWEHNHCLHAHHLVCWSEQYGLTFKADSSFFFFFFPHWVNRKKCHRWYCRTLQYKQG